MTTRVDRQDLAPCDNSLLICCIPNRVAKLRECLDYTLTTPCSSEPLTFQERKSIRTQS